MSVADREIRDLGYVLMILLVLFVVPESFDRR